MSNLQVSFERVESKCQIPEAPCESQGYDALSKRFREIVDMSVKGEKTMVRYWKGLLFSRRQSDMDYRPTDPRRRFNRSIRKHRYEYGTDLFNWKPDRGIEFLIEEGFLEKHPKSIAQFLLKGKGLSKRMIGEYLGDDQNAWNLAVTECFLQELDFFGMQVDVALRKFLEHLRMPKDIGKVETLLEVFSQHYSLCNADLVSTLRSIDTIFVLAFAMLVLDSNLHASDSNNAEKKQKLEDFVSDLGCINLGEDIDRNLLVGMYKRVQENKFKSDPDHVSEFEGICATVKGMTSDFAIPERRYVARFTLHEIKHIDEKRKPSQHLREVIVSNDLLLVVKPLTKKKHNFAYKLKHSFPLGNLTVEPWETSDYKYLVKLGRESNRMPVMFLDALNAFEHGLIVPCLQKMMKDCRAMASLKKKSKGENEMKVASGNHEVPKNRLGDSTSFQGINDLEQSDSVDT